MRILLLIIGCLVADMGWCCSCVKVTDEEEYRSASTVLLVQITETAFVPSSKVTEFDAVLAKFQVIQTYKGQQSPLQYLKTEKTTCEVPLIAGDMYLVFSRGQQFELLNACTRSRWINLTRDKELLNEFSRRK